MESFIFHNGMKVQLFDLTGTASRGRLRSRRATDDRQTVSPSGSLPWTLSVGWVLAQIYTTTTRTASTDRGIIYTKQGVDCTFEL